MSPVGAPDVDKRTLNELLARAAEADDLDFKQSVHLDDAAGRTEMAKDIAAMASAGGYLVIGVDDSGKPVPPGTQAYNRKLDPANSAGMLGRWLPNGVVFVSATHEVDGVCVSLIGVEAHPDGLVVMEADGEYEERGRRRQRFHAGQALVRRNTRSIPAVQSDVGDALRRLNASLPKVDATLIPAYGNAQVRSIQYSEELSSTRGQRVRRNVASFGELVGAALGPPLGIPGLGAIGAAAARTKFEAAGYALELVVRNDASALWEDVLVQLEFPGEVVTLREDEMHGLLSASNPATALERLDRQDGHRVDLSAGEVRPDAVSSVMRLIVLSPPVRGNLLRVPWRLTARNGSGRREGLLEIEVQAPPNAVGPSTV